MKRARILPAQHGLTLIEVMVAIVIFAVLGIISFRAVSGMVDARDRMNAEFGRWRSIARVMQTVENDLTQLAPRPMGGVSQTQPALVVVKGGEIEELRLTRFDTANGGLQRRAYRLEKDALVLARQPRLDDSAEPEQDVLLKDVKSLHWSFIVGKQRVNNWVASPQQPNALPEAVVMELELADVGPLTRIFALR